MAARRFYDCTGFYSGRLADYPPRLEGLDAKAKILSASCPWRIAKFMRRLESDTTLDSVSATDMSLDQWVTCHHLPLAGVLPTQRARGDHYSNVEIRAAFSPDRL